MIRNWLLIIVLLLMFCPFAYCGWKDEVKRIKTIELEKMGKIDFALYELTRVNKKERIHIADKYNLELRQDRVLVVIELSEEPNALEDLKKYDIKIMREYKNFIKAFVRIDDIKLLAQETFVKFIRRPEKPKPLKINK